MQPSLSSERRKRSSMASARLFAVAASALLLQPAAAQRSPGGPARLTALDYAEIKRVIGQYNLGMDSTGRVDRGALVGRAFTSDSMFYRPGAAVMRGGEPVAAEAAKLR